MPEFFGVVPKDPVELGLGRGAAEVFVHVTKINQFPELVPFHRLEQVRDVREFRTPQRFHQIDFGFRVHVFFGLLFLFRLFFWSEIFRPERFCCISLKLANARKKKKKRNRQDEKFFGLVQNRYVFFDFFLKSLKSIENISLNTRLGGCGIKHPHISGPRELRLGVSELATANATSAA